MFDVEKLTTFAVAEISKFAAEHQDETFYAFAIDASLLCLNSIERFEESLAHWRDEWSANNKFLDIRTLSEKETRQLSKQVAENIEYAASAGPDGSPLTLEELIREQNEIRRAIREGGNPYLTKQGIRELRDNTGDWHYQGYVQMAGEQRFDEVAYGKHYDMTEREQKGSAYAKAMDALIIRIKLSGALLQLKRTKDFQIRRVEHNY